MLVKTDVRGGPQRSIGASLRLEPALCLNFNHCYVIGPPELPNLAKKMQNNGHCAVETVMLTVYVENFPSMFHCICSMFMSWFAYVGAK